MRSKVNSDINWFSTLLSEPKTEITELKLN